MSKSLFLKFSVQFLQPWLRPCAPHTLLRDFYSDMTIYYQLFLNYFHFSIYFVHKNEIGIENAHDSPKEWKSVMKKEVLGWSRLPKCYHNIRSGFIMHVLQYNCNMKIFPIFHSQFPLAENTDISCSHKDCSFSAFIFLRRFFLFSKFHCKFYIACVDIICTLTHAFTFRFKFTCRLVCSFTV